MIPSLLTQFTVRARLRRSRLLFSTCAGVSLLAGALHASPIPQNLGPGLDALVESNLKLKAAQTAGTASSLPLYNGYATEKASMMADLAIQDQSRRVLIRLHPNGVKSIADIQTAAVAAAPSLKVTAVDTAYHGAGVLEGYASIDDVPALAGLEGVAAVRLTPKPIHARLRGQPGKSTTPGMPNATVGETLNKVGTVYDFGVTQHRVDQISKIYNPAATLDYEGRGVSVGIMSDSFDAKNGAAKDVTSGDLPGAGGAVNTQPVVVLQDFSGGEDEGRAMTQTVFKMAPKSRLAFATADTGEVGFANNIRALAGLKGYTYPAATQQGFKADVVVDDVSYLDEPFFQDGIIAQAVNNVAEAGTSYFSSAANNIGVSGYDSEFRFVANGTGMTAAAGNKALVGTNINLSTVPEALYAGGFHNFNPNGLDVAQLVNFPNATTLAQYVLTSLPVLLQWNDPDDTTIPSYDHTAIFTGSGTIIANPATQSSNTVSFQVPLTKGQQYYFVEMPASTSTTPGDMPLDGIITLVAPDGSTVARTDVSGAGTPETALTFAPVTGTYTVSINGFQSAAAMDFTDGMFTLKIYKSNGTQEVTQDLNLLVFDLSGKYLASSSATTNNLANNSPIEFVSLVAPRASTQVQFVISRSNKQPTSGRAANRLRYICFGNGIPDLGPAEYFDYLTPVTFGHSAAPGANSVAAYPYYRPSLPEAFTSPGPVTTYFDAMSKPLATPVVRQKPDEAAMDGANTTFFASDDDNDMDSNPNFFGTSNASPHAAAIAALVLEAHGGPGSVTPPQMKSVLRSSAFMHDLDPFRSNGQAKTSDGGIVSIEIKSDNEDGNPGTTGAANPNSFGVSYTGPGSLTSLYLNTTGSAATSGNVTGGQNGLDTNGVYFQNDTPGVLFGRQKTFALGTSSAGLDSTTVTSKPLIKATAPMNAVQDLYYFSELLTFKEGAFTAGKVLHFTVQRNEFMSADVATSGGSSKEDSNADLLGGGVSLPDGKLKNNGMTFSGTTSTGAKFDGYIVNQIGTGYTPLDGFGFINAQTAVTLPIAK